jgi:hypothetical protein
MAGGHEGERELTSQGGVNKDSNANNPLALLTEDKPHEQIVDIIKHTLAQKREEWEKKYGVGSFDPVEWVGMQLTKQRFTNPLRHTDPYSNQLNDIVAAWDSISIPHVKSGNYRDALRDVLHNKAEIILVSDEGRARWTNTRRPGVREGDTVTVTLEPKAVKLIDAMADAVGIPRTRGEATFDLLKYAPPIPVIFRK